MKKEVLLVGIHNGTTVEEFAFLPSTKYRFEKEENTGLHLLRVGASVFPAWRVVFVVMTSKLAAHTENVPAHGEALDPTVLFVEGD